MKIEITDTETGETRTYLDSMIWGVNEDDDKTHRYLWEDGNLACDGNRAQFFARAGGEPEPEEHVCGDSRYEIVFAGMES